LIGIKADDVEGAAADENDHYLATDHDAIDDYEEDVAVDALKDVELVVETTVAILVLARVYHVLEEEEDLLELVKNLHPDKGVENECFELRDLFFGGIIENVSAGKVENEGSDELEDSLPDNHFPHV
jgi:hypothetical protein